MLKMVRILVTSVPSFIILVVINLQLATGDIDVISRETGDVVFSMEDTQALSMPERETEEGIEGFLVYSNPPDACTKPSSPPIFPVGVKWILLAKHSEDCGLRNKTDNAIFGGYDGIIIHNVGSNSSEDMDEAFDPTESLIWTCFIGEYDGTVLRTNFSYPSDKQFTSYARITPDSTGGGSSLSEWLIFLVAFLVILCFCALLVVPILMLWNAILGCVDKCRRVRRRRIRTSIINRFPVTDWAAGDAHQTCVICLEDFISNDKVRVLPCNHGFHTDCIDPWLRKCKKFCPICKRKVIRISENVEQGSDSDNEETPLLRASRPTVSINSPVTGTTFVQQSENPFRRAFRVARERRMRARQNRQTGTSAAAAVPAPSTPSADQTPTTSTTTTDSTTKGLPGVFTSANAGLGFALPSTSESIASTSTSTCGPSTSSTSLAISQSQITNHVSDRNTSESLPVDSVIDRNSVST